MTNTIYRHLLYDELGIVTKRDKLPMLSEEGMLTHLGLDKLDGFLHLVEDGTLESHIFDDIHLCPYLLVNTLIADEASAGTGKEFLWILAK